MKRFMMLLIAVFVLVACNGDEEPAGVFAYKDTYIGDASQVRAIVEELAGAEQFVQLELYTEYEPYGLQLQYDQLSEADALHNATYLFTLVQNVDWVHFTIGEQAYELTRQQLNELYDIDLRNIHDEQMLKERMNKIASAQ